MPRKAKDQKETNLKFYNRETTKPICRRYEAENNKKDKGVHLYVKTLHDLT